MTDIHREVIAAYRRLDALLEEAAGRGKGLRHPSHKATLTAARAKITKVVRVYFKRQEVAILAAMRPKIGAALQAHPYPIVEAWARLLRGDVTFIEAFIEAGQARTPQAKAFASTLLPSSMAPLRFPATSAEDAEYTDAISNAIAGAAATAASELATDATLNDTAASRYLRDNSLSKLTGELQGATLDRLRNALSDAWENGGSYDQMIGAVKATFEDFSDNRADMIAQTEANDAYNWGRIELATEAGFEEKAWDPDGEACEEICQPNVDAGWIGIDEDFPSGDDAPSAHPNCDCSVSFRKGSGGDE